MQASLGWLLIVLVLVYVALQVGLALYNYSHEPPHGTDDLPSTSDSPPTNSVISFYGGLRWRKRGIGATQPRWPWAKLDVGFDGVAIGPRFRWQPWRCPLWWFHTTDLRAESGDWALRLVINDTREVVIEVRQLGDVIKAMQSRGIRTGFVTEPIPWVKL